MNIIADLHTHTLACRHGFSTVTEVIRAAAEKKLLAVGLTEHGPGYPGSVSYAYFNTYRDIPAQMFGIRVLKGCEANLMDRDGKLDFTAEQLAKLDIVIASCHGEVTPCGSVEENTAMYLGAIRNPRVDVIGHPDSPKYPIDVLRVVQEAARCGVALEINNSSPAARPGSEAMCTAIIQAALQFGAKLAVASDAHYHMAVGEFSYALRLLKENNVPEEQVINSSWERLTNYLQQRRQAASSGD